MLNLGDQISVSSAFSLSFSLLSKKGFASSSLVSKTFFASLYWILRDTEISFGKLEVSS